MPFYIETNEQNVVIGRLHLNTESDLYADDPSMISVSPEQYLQAKDFKEKIVTFVDGVITVGPAPVGSIDDFLGVLRADRDRFLADSDWTQANDSPLSDEKKAEWRVYRQTLRDLPASTSDPANPQWPAKP